MYGFILGRFKILGCIPKFTNNVLHSEIQCVLEEFQKTPFDLFLEFYNRLPKAQLPCLLWKEGFHFHR